MGDISDGIKKLLERKIVRALYDIIYHIYVNYFKPGIIFVLLENILKSFALAHTLHTRIFFSLIQHYF